MSPFLARAATFLGVALGLLASSVAAATPPSDSSLFGVSTPLFATTAPALTADSFTEKDAPEIDEKTGERYAPNLYRKFGISGGAAAYDDFTTNVRVSGNLVGTSIDFEDFLALDDSTTIARFDAYYNFNKRHRIDASYYDIRRSGSRTVAEDIQFGDVLIPAGTIESFFNTRIFKLAYRYNFVADTRTVIGASFGAHVMGIDAGLRNENDSAEESFNVAAPLPLVGLHGAYALSDTWSLNASYEFLKFDIEAYRGFIGDLRLTVENDLFEHFGWGVGFNGFKVDGNIEGDGRLEADLEYGYQGLMLYLRGYF